VTCRWRYRQCGLPGDVWDLVTDFLEFSVFVAEGCLAVWVRGSKHSVERRRSFWRSGCILWSGGYSFVVCMCLYVVVSALPYRIWSIHEGRERQPAKLVTRTITSLPLDRTCVPIFLFPFITFLFMTITLQHTKHEHSYIHPVSKHPRYWPSLSILSLI